MGDTTHEKVAAFVRNTPFHPEEVMATLRLSVRDVLTAIEDGVLAASITLGDDPHGRLRMHAVRDVLRLELFLRAGWPLKLDAPLRAHIEVLCDRLVRIVEDEPLDFLHFGMVGQRTGRADPLEGWSPLPDAPDLPCRLDYIERTGPLVLSDIVNKLWHRAAYWPVFLAAEKRAAEWDRDIRACR